LLAAADLLVVHLRRSESGAVSLPSRIMAYMACARPMIVAAEGAPRRVVESAHCGLVVNPGDPNTLADAIRTLRADPERRAAMAAAGRKYYLEHFSESAGVGRLADELERISLS
jgi:colanic acid biosynthesis glycosyl transferase WcaI